MRLLSAFGTLVFIGIATAATASEVTATVAVTVQVSSRTSLRVSSELLEYANGDRTTPTAAVDFRAAARVPGSDVVLTVEALRAIEGPGGAADVEAGVTFSGEGEGTLAGSLGSLQPAVAGRWHGSGVREGRLVFTLHASAAGTYSLPVRFVLSTP